MRINFAQFPIYDGIKKEKLIASNITEAFGDWIYKNVAGLKAHLLAEKIFKSTAEGVEIDEEEVDIIRRSTSMLPGLLADSLNDYLDKKEEQHEKGILYQPSGKGAACVQFLPYDNNRSVCFKQATGRENHSESEKP